MKRLWWLGAFAIVAAGCGGDGNNGGSGGNVIPSATVAAVTSDRRIVVFNTNTPDSIINQYQIDGLPSNDPVASLDYRPDAPNLLYLVTESGAIYTVSDLGVNETLTATLVGDIDNGNDDVKEVDFNPVADRLRVATDNNGSLRVDVSNAATTTDTDFAYAPPSPLIAEIEGVAYTNSTQTATSTTLFGIDVRQNTLVRVDPPNAGTLTSVGPLGFDVEGPVPFDISPADATLGFFTQESNGRSRLYSIDTTDGSTIRGRLTPSGVRIVGLTVLPNS